MKLLFLCTGNSCRSQMAEAWARELAPLYAPELELQFFSAGIEAHGLNPMAVATMRKHGVDISNHSSDPVTDEMLRHSDLVITVCSDADSRCPVLPAATEKLHMPFVDPARAEGSADEIEEGFDRVCEHIKIQMIALLTRLASASSK
ncbi:MAG: arsenate reductase ArsC [Proteobacteria bacterium]|nr:arsenate reductase ArsC [Pseudomonadota bacterium]